MSTPVQKIRPSDIQVRPMRESDLADVRRIFRVAFGTFIGAPDPESFWADREYIFTRWRADPSSGLAAEMGGRVVGSNFIAKWGSFGFFGPLTVEPALWDQGVAQKLLGPTVDLLEQAGVRESALFTFAHSPKHIALYQKFGFWPRFLSALMFKEVRATGAQFDTYSTLKGSERKQALDACRTVTGSVYEGLDLSSEIEAVADQNLGETLLLWGGDQLDAFAVCHCGEGTEAGRDACYVKFAAARSGPGAETAFERLLNACEALAQERGLHQIHAGVNLARRGAYRQMLSHGYRVTAQGVAMHRPDAPAYNRPDAFVIDDWR